MSIDVSSLFLKHYVHLTYLFVVVKGNWNYFAAIRNEKRNPKLEATHLEKAKELYTRVWMPSSSELPFSLWDFLHPKTSIFLVYLIVISFISLDLQYGCCHWLASL